MAAGPAHLPAALDRALALLTPEARRHGRLAAGGYLDLIGDRAPESTGAAQDLMVGRFVPTVYERWWRPALGRVAKGVFGPGMADEHRIARLLLGLSPGDGVLDVACGTGNFTRDFARSVGADGLVVGIDVSETMLTRAVADTRTGQLSDRAAGCRLAMDQRTRAILTQQITPKKFERLQWDHGLRERKTMTDYLAAALRTAIYDGQFADGEELNQVELAQFFGVSRVPIREALRQLQAEGLVQNIAHHRTIVAGLTLPQITELIEMRAVLESYMLRKSAPKLDKAVLDRIRRICNETAIFGNPDQIARKLEDLQAGGVEYVLINFGGSRDNIRRFAREIMPAFADPPKHAVAAN